MPESPRFDRRDPETTINQRIKRLIVWIGKQKEFARVTRIPESTLSSIVSTRQVKPDLDTLQKILKAYPQVSAEWLHTGKGGMLLNEARPVTLFFQPTEPETKKMENAEQNFEDSVIQRLLTPLEEDLQKLDLQKQEIIENYDAKKQEAVDNIEAKKEEIRKLIRRLKNGLS